MNSIPVGSLIFYKPTDLLGDMIAYYTHGAFSHVGVALTPNTYVDAEYPMVKVSPIPDGGTVWTPGPSDFVTPGEGLLFLHSIIGDPYSLWDIMNSGLAPIAPLYVHDPKMVDCSVATMMYLQRSGYTTAIDYTPAIDAISPNDIARLVGLLS